MTNPAGLQGRVSRLLREHQIPSATIGVLRDGKVSEFAVGVRDLTTREPATTDTIYQLGSMSKTWTALAFMQLVDEGKARLDEPVRTYLPGFRVANPAVTAGVTARHLLNHTNGIEEQFGDPGARATTSTSAWSPTSPRRPRCSPSARPTATAQPSATRSSPGSWRSSTVSAGTRS